MENQICFLPWPVIQSGIKIISNIGPNEEVINRPDIVVKVFNQKVKELKEEICKKHIFGKCIAFTYVIEFQKRGLSHIHMLIFLDKEDQIISAEIHDKSTNPQLYKIVKHIMIHGPCGQQNINSPCMDKNVEQSTKKFPKQFINNTIIISGYPLYRRRNDGRTIHYSKNKWVNNMFVVPYNPYLLLKFNSHINLEVCSSVLCVKYLFKYCYNKGHDCAFIEMKLDNDINE